MDKTISFLILIGIGIAFRSKIRNQEQIDTIKTLILTLALPAVIFSALLKIDFNSSLIYPPLLVLGFNFALFLSVRWMLPVLIGKNFRQANLQTLSLMLPSLAPYLSCFPFIAEFSDDTTLGIAAIADTGNKLFILVFLYFLAMYWTYGRQMFSRQVKKSNKFQSILLQPINLSIILALTASLLGVRLATIPLYFQDSLTHLSNLLTPTILLFIGLAVKIKGKELKTILGLLLWRSAIAFILSGLCIALFDFNSVATTLLVVAFPQSSCSFIPYAQMTIFSDLKDPSQKKVFNPSMALSLLAISLPISAFTIIAIYSSGDFFTSSIHLVGVGAVALILSCVLLRQQVKRQPTFAPLLSIPEKEVQRDNKTKVLAKTAKR